MVEVSWKLSRNILRVFIHVSAVGYCQGLGYHTFKITSKETNILLLGNIYRTECHLLYCELGKYIVHITVLNVLTLQKTL